jgi:N6-adenosine-specific RNA methylase IME4
MKRINLDFEEYMKKMRHKNYAIIDPPWYLNDKPPKVGRQLKYTLWSDNVAGLYHILRNIKTDIIFLWYIKAIEFDIWDTIVNYFDKEWIVKTDITWVKKTVNGLIHFGTGHWFRNSTEGLKLIVKKGTKPIRLPMRNVVVAKRKPLTEKPKAWEEKLIYNLYKRGYKKGCYLFSGTNIERFEPYNIDCVDIRL